MHLRSDVDIAMALSGGVDSTAIISCIKFLKPNTNIEAFTYSAQNESINEVKWSSKVSEDLGINNHHVKINNEQFQEDFKDLIKIQGEPFGSTSIYASYCVYRAIKENNYKVVLDGQGGDEVLGGYDGYPHAKVRNFINKNNYSEYFIYEKLIKKL